MGDDSRIWIPERNVHTVDELIMAYYSDLQLLPVQLSTTSAQLSRCLFGGNVTLRLSHHFVPMFRQLEVT